MPLPVGHRLLPFSSSSSSTSPLWALASSKPSRLPRPAPPASASDPPWPRHSPLPPPPPPPPPPHARVRLENLPEDTQRLILDRIPCSVDRGRMSLVCHAWRHLILNQRSQIAGPLLQLPPPLPWLLLRAPFAVGGLVPSTRAVSGLVRSTRAVCVLSGCRAHHYLNIDPSDARCFGSHEGAWLFLNNANRPSPHVALNIRTGLVCEFPRHLQRWNDLDYAHTMFIHAAALSHSPEDQWCVGAAIVTSWTNPATGSVAALQLRQRSIAFWVKDRGVAWDFASDGHGPDVFDAEDVIYRYHSETFVFVTEDEHLHQYKPCRYNMMNTTWKTLHFRPRGGLDDLHVRARYLVASGGELLMVVRFAPHPNQPTSMFKVFQQTKRDMEDADFPVAQYPWAWSEVDTLGDRILFVGHGCSRCYTADQYPGFKGGIYFLDDGKFYDDSVIFGNGNVRRYPCSDNGKWSEGHVERCFPRPDPSDHSAPVWLLP